MEPKNVVREPRDVPVWFAFPPFGAELDQQQIVTKPERVEQFLADGWGVVGPFRPASAIDAAAGQKGGGA